MTETTIEDLPEDLFDLIAQKIPRELHLPLRLSSYYWNIVGTRLDLRYVAEHGYLDLYRWGRRMGLFLGRQPAFERGSVKISPVEYALYGDQLEMAQYLYYEGYEIPIDCIHYSERGRAWIEREKTS